MRIALRCGAGTTNPRSPAARDRPTALGAHLQCAGTLGVRLSADSGPGSDPWQILRYLCAQVSRGSSRSRIPSRTREGAGLPHAAPSPAPLRAAPRTHRRGVPAAAAACPRPRHRAGIGSGSASGAESERVSGDPGAGRPRPSPPREEPLPPAANAGGPPGCRAGRGQGLPGKGRQKSIAAGRNEVKSDLQKENPSRVLHSQPFTAKSSLPGLLPGQRGRTLQGVRHNEHQRWATRCPNVRPSGIKE